MYVNTTAEVKAETDYCCTSSNAVQVVEHIWREHGEDTEILFGPDMFLGAYVEKVTGRRMNVWTGECHVHAGIRPSDIAEVREANPGADFLIHPECGCSTSVMEYVAAGDVDAENTHMLSTGGMLKHAHESDADTFIVATETGMLHPLERDNPGKTFVPANEAAVCQFMKMITLPKLRDCLRDLSAGRDGRPRDRRARAGADRAHGGDQPLGVVGRRARRRLSLSRSCRSPLPRGSRAADPTREPEPLLPLPELAGAAAARCPGPSRRFPGPELLRRGAPRSPRPALPPPRRRRLSAAVLVGLLAPASPGAVAVPIVVVIAAAPRAGGRPSRPWPRRRRTRRRASRVRAAPAGRGGFCLASRGAEVGAAVGGARVG